MKLKNERIPTQLLVLCALFAALIAVGAQIAIPMWPANITLQTMAVVLCAALLPKEYAALTAEVYMMMGLVGMPVFSNLGSGVGILFGRTGGYILGFLPCAFITSLMIEKLGRSWLMQVLSMAVGTLVCYVFGTAWFMVLTHLGLWKSLTLCVIPYLPGDCIKIALAAFLSTKLYGPMKRVVHS